MIVTNVGNFAIGKLLPSRRAIPVLSNEAKTAYLPASRSDIRWHTWHRYVRGRVEDVSYQSNGSPYVSYMDLLVHWASYCLDEHTKSLGWHVDMAK